MRLDLLWCSNIQAEMDLPYYPAPSMEEIVKVEVGIEKLFFSIPLTMDLGQM